MFSRILEIVEKFCFGLSKFALFAIMVCTSIDVLALKIFNLAIPSVYEFTEEYLMVALVYLSLSTIMVIGGHIRVTLFLHWIPKAVRPVLDRVLMFGGLVLFGSIAFLGWETAMQAFEFGETSNSYMAYPLGPSYLLIPIGAGLMSIRILQKMIFPKIFGEEE